MDALFQWMSKMELVCVTLCIIVLSPTRLFLAVAVQAPLMIAIGRNIYSQMANLLAR